MEFCQEALNFGLLIVMSAESLRPSCVASLGNHGELVDADPTLWSNHLWIASLKDINVLHRTLVSTKLKELVIFLALQ